MSRVYVGTYAKYNDGNLAGEWMDLEDYADKDEFLSACTELHKDEADPELMFQDFEDAPEGMVTESSIDPALWDWLALDEHERKVVEAYRGYVDQSATNEQALEAYRGKYESAADYAEEHWSESGELKKVPEAVRYHIDWKGVARDMCDNGQNFVEVAYHEVYVFN
jgi:antirestriction protein